jgi:hypothetical protein
MGERVGQIAKVPDVKQSNSNSLVRRTKRLQSMDTPVDRILFLQRTVGNQAVSRLMKSGALQAKLRIGQPRDVYEQEADRVADAMMRMPEPQAISDRAPHIQRACPTCEEDELRRQPIEEEEEELQRQPIEEEEEELQAKADNISEVNPNLESHIHSLKGGGQPLSENDRAFFEPRFGRDFSQVRVHTDTRAVESAQALNARAYTVGRDIVFNRGQYTEKTPSFQRLIAHELSHVIQQDEGNMASLSKLKHAHPRRERNERVAVEAAKAVIQNQRFAVSLHRTTQISREVSDAGVSDRSEQIECIRRLGGCPQTRSGGIPTELEISEYNQECRGETDYTGAPLQAEDLQCEVPEENPPVPAQPPSAPTPLHVAGCTEPDPSYKIIRIAWTLDDGPTEFTEGMRERLGERGGTWFIMRGLLGEGDELQRRLQNLFELQDEQHNEIAIHSMNPEHDHGAWFPVEVSEHVPRVYDTTDLAMQDLTDFAGLLRGAGLTIHFVRLPGGLISEVMAYLGSVDVQESQRRSIADRIIRGEDVTEDEPAARPVHDDYQTLQSTLTTLGLHLWGGEAGTPLTTGQSWEAESSGSGLTDDVTDRFNRLVHAFGRVHRPRSLIVLAHDANDQANVDEVGRDVQAMETCADDNGVKVEYYTLSDLFRVVRGEEPRASPRQ